MQRLLEDLRSAHAGFEDLPRTAAEEHGERRLFLVARALQRRQLCAHGSRFGLELAQVVLRDHATLEALALQDESILAQADVALGHGDLLVERAQSEVGLRHFGGECEAHALARCLGALQVGGSGARSRAQSAKQVDLP